MKNHSKPRPVLLSACVASVANNALRLGTGLPPMGGKKQRPSGKGAASMPPALHFDVAADLVVDDDDVAFVQSHRRQLQHLASAQLEEAPCAPVAQLG